MRGRWIAYGFASALGLLLSFSAAAKGPFGSIRVGHWTGGAYTDEQTGAFSHCGAGASYQHGVFFIVGMDTSGGWSMAFTHDAWRLTPGDSFPIDLTFDGRAQFRIFAAARNATLITSMLGRNPALVQEMSKAAMMSASVKGTVIQFDLAGSAQMLPAVANCVAVMKKGGLAAAGDFTVKTPAPQSDGAPPSREARKSYKAYGSGFVIASEGYVITNHHVIRHCGDEAQAELTGESPITLRIVSRDPANDLALLKASAPFKESANVRATPIHPGESVIVIGYPYPGMLASEFSVTTGIVSSLGGIGNDSRFLQISAPVQPGNSGGPLFDSSGNIVGVVTSRLDSLRVVQITGTLPENINFAVKTGPLRDFLDRQSVPYKAVAPATELKTAEIAEKARGFTVQISCVVNK